MCPLSNNSILWPTNHMSTSWGDALHYMLPFYRSNSGSIRNLWAHKGRGKSKKTLIPVHPNIYVVSFSVVLAGTLIAVAKSSKVSRVNSTRSDQKLNKLAHGADWKKMRPTTKIYKLQSPRGKVPRSNSCPPRRSAGTWVLLFRLQPVPCQDLVVGAPGQSWLPAEF